jgi:hypothetical protein
MMVVVGSMNDFISFNKTQVLLIYKSQVKTIRRSVPSLLVIVGGHRKKTDVISAVFGGIISCAGYLCDFVSE